jgi:hypothetical protein
MGLDQGSYTFALGVITKIEKNILLTRTWCTVHNCKSIRRSATSGKPFSGNFRKKSLARFFAFKRHLPSCLTVGKDMGGF